MTNARKPRFRRVKTVGAEQPEWDLRLYVAGQTPRSLAAIRNLRKICHEHMSGQYRMRVIDVLANPDLSREDQIVAIPTLVRKSPSPTRKIIGDFSDTARTLADLEFRPLPPSADQPLNERPGRL